MNKNRETAQKRSAPSSMVPPYEKSSHRKKDGKRLADWLQP